MGKIKKILENELTGGNQSTEIYPVTSIKAVYDENNERLDNIIDRKDNEIQKELEAEVARATNAESNLRETINNITEVNENATSANIVTIDTIPNTSSSNVQQALNELYNTIGELDKLDTQAKDNIVSAINEARLTGGSAVSTIKMTEAEAIYVQDNYSYVNTSRATRAENGYKIMVFLIPESTISVSYPLVVSGSSASTRRGSGFDGFGFANNDDWAKRFTSGEEGSYVTQKKPDGAVFFICCVRNTIPFEGVDFKISANTLLKVDKEIYPIYEHASATDAGINPLNSFPFFNGHIAKIKLDTTKRYTVKFSNRSKVASDKDLFLDADGAVLKSFSWGSEYNGLVVDIPDNTEFLVISNPPRNLHVTVKELVTEEDTRLIISQIEQNKSEVDATLGDLSKLAVFNYKDISTTLMYILSKIYSTPDTVPDYTLSETAKSLVEKVKSEYSQVNPDNKYMSFAVMSDLHTLPAEITGISTYINCDCAENVKLFGYLLDELGCDAGFCLGDFSEYRLVTTPEVFGLTVEEGKEIYHNVMKYVRNLLLSSSSKPIFMMKGNHESSADITNTEWLEYMLNTNRLSPNIDIKYTKYHNLTGSYRIDFLNYKTRIVMLDENEPEVEDMRDVAVELIDLDSDGYNPREWLAATIVHGNIISTFDRSYLGSLCKGDKLRYGSHSFQLSDKIRGSIGIISGHTHNDSLIKDTYQKGDYTIHINKSYYNRKDNLLETDYCITIFIIDTDAMKVHALRVGGEDWNNWEGKDEGKSAPEFPISYDMYHL